MKSLKSSCQRSTRGQHSLELLMGMVAVVMVALALTDVAVLAVGWTINLNAARNAARTAASGNPENWLLNASIALIGFPTNTIFDNPAIKVEDSGVTVIEKPNSAYGGQFKGSVQLSTKMSVHLPFSVASLIPSTIEFHASQEFPITYVAPPVRMAAQ